MALVPRGPGRRLLLNSSATAALLSELLADNRVTDQAIRNNLAIDAVIGAALVCLFCLLQRRSILYRFRLVSACCWLHAHPAGASKGSPLARAAACSAATGVGRWVAGKTARTLPPGARAAACAAQPRVGQVLWWWRGRVAAHTRAARPRVRGPKRGSGGGGGARSSRPA